MQGTTLRSSLCNATGSLPPAGLVLAAAAEKAAAGSRWARRQRSSTSAPRHFLCTVRYLLVLATTTRTIMDTCNNDIIPIIVIIIITLTYLYHHHHQYHHQHLVPYTHKVHIVVEWRTDEAEVPHGHLKPGSNHITFTIQDHAHAHASRSRLTFTTTGARGSDASGCISLNPFSRCARVCVRPVPDSSTYYGTRYLPTTTVGCSSHANSNNHNNHTYPPNNE